MTQINIRVDSEIEKFIEIKSRIEGKSKSLISKEIFLKGVSMIMMPFFATLYRESKISIKEIARLTNQEPSAVIDQIAKLTDDIEMDDELIEYSHEIGNKIQPYLFEAKQFQISDGYHLMRLINTKILYSFE